MIPLATHAVSIERPSSTAADPDEATATPTTVASAVAAAITAPSGADLLVGGRQEVVDAVLTFPATPALTRLDFVVDDTTGDRYRVMWTRSRPGLGLDHQTAGLRAVTGGAGG